jgi:hypothetical protein
MRQRSSIPLLLLTLTLTAATLAQSPVAAAPNLISLWLLDADTGKPIPHLRALVYGEAGGKPLPINPLGDLYEVDVTAQSSLNLGEITSTTPDATDFTACVAQSIRAFDIKQIQTAGIAPQNRCSKKSHTAAPGELVIFLRRTHWWERWEKAD